MLTLLLIPKNLATLIASVRETQAFGEVGAVRNQPQEFTSVAAYKRNIFLR